MKLIAWESKAHKEIQKVIGNNSYINADGELILEGSAVEFAEAVTV